MKNYLKIAFIACITILCKFHQGLTTEDYNNKGNKGSNDVDENDNEDVRH